MRLATYAVTCRSAKYFPFMPLHIGFSGSINGANRCPELPTVVAHQQLLKALSAAVRFFRHEHFALRSYCKNAPIEQLVMQCAEGDAIVFRVRPTRQVPTNMGCLDADQLMTKANMKAANCAAIFISAKDDMTKFGISSTLTCAFQIQADFSQQVRVH